MKKAIILFFFLPSLTALAQSPQLRWIKAITSPGEVLYPVYETALPDEGVAITGWQQRDWQPWSAIFVIALDSSGNELWRDSIEKVNSNDEMYLHGITSTPQGEVIVTGEFNGVLQCSGNLVSDSGFICNSTYIARFSHNTLSSFKAVYGAGATALTSDSDGNLLFTMEMCGSGHGFGASWNALGAHDMMVCKVSPSDSLLWFKQFSGTLYSGLLTVNPDDETVLFGAFYDTLFFDTYHYSPQHNGPWGSDIFIMYIDAAGSITHSRISYTSMLYPSQVLFNNDNLILTSAICGNHECGVGFQKADSTLTSLWYDGFPAMPLGYGDYYNTNHIASVDISGFWAFGTVRAGMMGDTAFAIHDYVFTHFDFNGNILSTDSFPTPYGDFPFYYGDCEAASSRTGIYFTGMFRDSLTLYNQTVTGSEVQMFVCRMTQGSVVGIAEPSLENQFSIYPNPNNGTFTIRTLKQTELKIYNSFGQLIHQQITKSTNQQIDLSSQLKGIYIVEAGNERRKVVLN